MDPDAETDRRPAAGRHARALKLAVDEAIQQRRPKAYSQQIAGQKLMLLILKRHKGVAR